MPAAYDVIYLSPHLDDAILSCGGQIYQQARDGKKVLIVTLMAGELPSGALSPFAQSLHQRWQLASDAVAVRRAEDIAACAIVGADYRHWMLPDCIYRRHPASGEALYQVEQQLFGDLHPAETALVGKLARQMAALLGHQRLVVPLAVGGHVDHQLARLAAEQLPGPAAISYYEDYPYAQEDGTLETALDNQASWRPVIIPLTETALEKKCEAISCYKSQVGTFFRDRDDLEKSVRDYASAVGGERLWTMSLPSE